MIAVRRIVLVECSISGAVRSARKEESRRMGKGDAEKGNGTLHGVAVRST